MANVRVIVLVAVLAAVPLLAGYMNGPNSASAALPTQTAPTAPWYEAALARDAGHDHTDLTQHLGASTPNFQKLGHDPLLSQHYGGKPTGVYGCGDSTTRPDGRRLTIAASFLDDMAFALVDVTDPAHPTKVGEFYSQGVGSWDAAITRDGRYALLALNGLARIPSTGLAAPAIVGYRDACGHDSLVAGPDIAVTEGMMLIDVTDVAHPKYADYDPMPGINTHSVSTAAVDGYQYVIGAMVNIVHSATYFVFDIVVDTPAGGKLVRLSTFDSPPFSTSTAAPASVVIPEQNGHVDAVMEKHPVDGRTYAYLADWDGGVLVLDVTVPVAPIMVAQWLPPATGVTSGILGGSCNGGAIHTVLTNEGLWEGKHLLFAGQECPGKNSPQARSGSVFVLDITSPLSTTLIGDWHLPENTGVWTTSYQASPHYIAITGRTLFVSDYHAGLWAVDVGPGKLTSPPSIGVFLPDEAPPVTPQRTGNPTPFDEQVDAFADGTLVLLDDVSGVYTLRFDASSPMPPAAPYTYK
ncbi:MAG: hypothetical protein WDA16_12270 [Candidatus Thermoplasmatota archaeon]